MLNRKHIYESLLSAAATFTYIFLITWFMSNASAIFGEADDPLTPLFVLLLFVISACVVGGLVLGKPILLYLEGERKDAIGLFSLTLGWLFLFLVAVATVMLLR